MAFGSKRRRRRKQVLERERSDLRDILLEDVDDPFGSSATSAARGELADTLTRRGRRDNRLLASRGLQGGEFSLALSGQRSQLAGSSLRQILMNAFRRRQGALGQLVGQTEGALTRQQQERNARLRAIFEGLGQAGQGFATAIGKNRNRDNQPTFGNPPTSPPPPPGGGIRL